MPSVNDAADAITRSTSNASDLAGSIGAGADVLGQLTAAVAALGAEGHAHEAAAICVDLVAMRERADHLTSDLAMLQERVELLKR
ncbi:hypothetical protein [Glycomyces sp. YM15]|uniref:hypothetical protein n=1 Tax=Glycomyces sp. YM15 TaxID=2800446 RepID=UPI0019631F77|nr:hypothetical protein [Glycomyces sp. YM15]